MKKLHRHSPRNRNGTSIIQGDMGGGYHGLIKAVTVQICFLMTCSQVCNWPVVSQLVSLLNSVNSRIILHNN